MTAHTHLLHHLVEASAHRHPNAAALTAGPATLNYDTLTSRLRGWGSGLLRLGVLRGQRVAVFLEKRLETVVACFGTSAAGCVFVPINPGLKPHQIGHILRDCAVQVLLTSPERLLTLRETLPQCPALRHVVLTGSSPWPEDLVQAVHRFDDLVDTGGEAAHRVIDSDMAAILYTSGSTGQPKGVVLSHRNMVIGAKSVAQYLDNHTEDTLLAALPLSFDAGFSQLTTAFHAGARVVLLNHVLPQDVVKAMVRERVTGLTAVPPLWIQLSQLDWPESIDTHLRYLANTGGRMPLETLKRLRERAPSARPFLMYGLTEAFRATYLPPEQVDTRPDSIGQAIPDNEVLVLRPDGTPCDVDEPGELVQRGPLVALGYWNDPDRTAERFRRLPVEAGVRDSGIVLPEVAVFSGDIVRRDAEGYLYFIGRRDEMIKTSGYRVSPTEIEEVLYATGLVGECAAFGVDDDTLGQAIRVVVTPAGGARDLQVDALLRECRQRLPIYMVPRQVDVRPGPLPRNPNGKIDRKALSIEAS